LVLILNSSLSSFAEKSSPANFHRSTLSPEGPKIIDSKLKVELVFEGVGFFSNMAFLGLDGIWALDKNEGTVQRIVNETMPSEPIFDAKVATRSERGMLGIAISSKYKTNEQVNNQQKGDYHYDVEDSSKKDKYVFLYFTEVKTSDGVDMDGSNPIGNRLYRYELINDTQLGNDNN